MKTIIGCIALNSTQSGETFNQAKPSRSSILDLGTLIRLWSDYLAISVYYSLISDSGAICALLSLVDVVTHHADVQYVVYSYHYHSSNHTVTRIMVLSPFHLLKAFESAVFSFSHNIHETMRSILLFHAWLVLWRIHSFIERKLHLPYYPL